MSCGLTVVATNTQVNRELLANGRGIIVEPTINSIIDGIKKAVDVDRFKIAQDSRKYILNNYDWSRKSNEILEVLK